MSSPLDSLLLRYSAPVPSAVIFCSTVCASNRNDVDSPCPGAGVIAAKEFYVARLKDITAENYFTSISLINSNRTKRILEHIAWMNGVGVAMRESSFCFKNRGTERLFQHSSQ